MTGRGPNLSTSQPSTGTSQVSTTTKIEKASWMEVRPQWFLASIGLTNRVQPYCRLAISAMHTMPMPSWTQRKPGPCSTFSLEWACARGMAMDGSTMGYLPCLFECRIEDRLSKHRLENALMRVKIIETRHARCP